MNRPDPSDWHFWEDPSNLADLIEWLDRSECLDMSIVVDLLRKPWHWQDEWAEMQREKAGPAPAEREEDGGELAALLEGSCALASAGVRRFR